MRLKSCLIYILMLKSTFQYYRATDSARTATVGTVLRLTETVLKEQNPDQDSIGMACVIRDLDKAIDDVLDRYTLVHILDMMHDSADNYII